MWRYKHVTPGNVLRVLWQIFVLLFWLVVGLFAFLWTFFSQLLVEVVRVGVRVARSALEKLGRVFLGVIDTISTLIKFIPVVGQQIGSALDWIVKRLEPQALLGGVLVLLLGFGMLIFVSAIGYGLRERQSEVMVRVDQAWCSTRNGVDRAADTFNWFATRLWERWIIHVINFVIGFYLVPIPVPVPVQPFIATVYTPVWSIRLGFLVVTALDFASDVDLQNLEDRTDTISSIVLFIAEVLRDFGALFVSENDFSRNCYTLDDQPRGGVCQFGARNGKNCANNLNCPGSTCVGGVNDGEGCLIPVNCPGGTCDAAFCDLLPPITPSLPETCRARESLANIDCGLDPTKCPALWEGECFSGPDTGSMCSLDSQCSNECVGGDTPGAVCTRSGDCPGGGVCDIGQCSVEHMCTPSRLRCDLQRVYNVFSEGLCSAILPLVLDTRFVSSLLTFVNETLPQAGCRFLDFFVSLSAVVLNAVEFVIDSIIDAVNSTTCAAQKIMCTLGVPFCNCGLNFACSGSCSGAGCTPFCNAVPIVVLPPFNPPSIHYPYRACSGTSGNPGDNCITASDCDGGTCLPGSCGSGGGTQGYGCNTGGNIGFDVTNCGAGIECHMAKCENGRRASDACGSNFDCSWCAGDTELSCNNDGDCGGNGPCRVRQCVTGRPCSDVTGGFLSFCPTVASAAAHVMSGEGVIPTLANLAREQPTTPLTDSSRFVVQRASPVADAAIVGSDEYSLENINEQWHTGDLDPEFQDSTCRRVNAEYVQWQQEHPDEMYDYTWDDDIVGCVMKYVGFMERKEYWQSQADVLQSSADQSVGESFHAQLEMHLQDALLDEILTRNTSLNIEDPCKFILEHPEQTDMHFSKSQYGRCILLYVSGHVAEYWSSGWIGSNTFTELDARGGLATQLTSAGLSLFGFGDWAMMPADTLLGEEQRGSLYYLLVQGFSSWSRHFFWSTTEDAGPIANIVSVERVDPQPVVRTRTGRQLLAFNERNETLVQFEEGFLETWLDAAADWLEARAADLLNWLDARPVLGEFVPVPRSGPEASDALVAAVEAVPDAFLDAFNRYDGPPDWLLCNYNPVVSRGGTYSFGCFLRVFIPPRLPRLPRDFNARLVPWPMTCTSGAPGCYTENFCSTDSDVCVGGDDDGKDCFLKDNCADSDCVSLGYCNVTGVDPIYNTCGSTWDCARCKRVCIGGTRAQEICTGFQDCPGGSCNVGTCYSKPDRPCLTGAECPRETQTCEAYEECKQYGFEDGFDNILWTLERFLPRVVDFWRADPILPNLPVVGGRINSRTSIEIPTVDLGGFLNGTLQRFNVEEGLPNTPKERFCVVYTSLSLAFPLFFIVAFFSIYYGTVAGIIVSVIYASWIWAALWRRFWSIVALARSQANAAYHARAEQAFEKIRNGGRVPREKTGVSIPVDVDAAEERAPLIAKQPRPRRSERYTKNKNT